MKKFLVIILTLNILIIFSGCCLNKNSVKKEEIEKNSTYGIRKIKKIKDTLEVKIYVYPQKGTTGVIVEENLPDGYSILEANPVYSKKEGNSYKWLIWSKNVENFEIFYKVKIEKKLPKNEKIKGYIKTLKEGMVEIKEEWKVDLFEKKRYKI